MKTLLIVGVAMVVAAARAEPTNAPPGSISQELAAAIARHLAETAVVPQEPKLNEVTAGKATCSGLTVLVARIDKPLQLVNPAAPARYGSFEDSVVREPINRKVVGVKIFAIDF